MNLPGIVSVSPDNQAFVEQLATMMGESFLEENWTRELLRGTANERLRDLSRAIIRHDMNIGLSHRACYALEDGSAMTIGYLRSEIGPRSWGELENTADTAYLKAALTPEEYARYEEQYERLEPISVFDWEEDEAAGSDFIHFVCLGVDANRRGSGAFRRLITPFFGYADEHGIPCFLETYSDKLESLYKHVGFETVRTYSDPAFPISEICMVRHPQ